MDLIIYGATGFTGTLACEYLDAIVKAAKENQAVNVKDRLFLGYQREFHHRNVGYSKTLGELKWAIAGRSVSKLNEMKVRYSSCSEVIIADSGDVASIDKMCKSTKVLLSFAGPFTRYGTPVVEACVRHGTHYCDSTGELPWVQQLMKNYHEKAVDNKSLIVPMCGFDCIPSDLNVFYAVQKLRERGVKSVKSAKSYGIMQGGISGGTLQTGIMMEKEFQSVLDDPFNLGGKESDDQYQVALKNQQSPEFSKELNTWTGPFMMEALNTRVVRRSAHDLEYRTKGLGGFYYSESALAGTEDRAKKMSKKGPSAEVRQKLVDAGKLPKAGEGPDFDTRRKSWFQILTNAVAEDGKTQLWTSVSGGDCGYEDTSLMCVESALCLALEYNSLPRKGGVLTPSVAFGSAIIERLDRAGLRFRCVGEKPVIRSKM